MGRHSCAFSKTAPVASYCCEEDLGWPLKVTGTTMWKLEVVFCNICQGQLMKQQRLLLKYFPTLTGRKLFLFRLSFPTRAWNSPCSLLFIVFSFFPFIFFKCETDWFLCRTLQKRVIQSFCPRCKKQKVIHHLSSTIYYGSGRKVSLIIIRFQRCRCWTWWTNEAYQVW